MKVNIKQTVEQGRLSVQCELHCIVLKKTALSVLKLGNLKGMQTCDWTSGPAGWQLNLTSCKTGDINISKQTDGKCSFDHIVIFVRPEKTLSPWPCYRFHSRKGTAVWFLSLTPPVHVASFLGGWGTKVIKNTAFPSATHGAFLALYFYFVLFFLWRCMLSSFLAYEVTGETKILYQHVCQLSTTPSVFPDKALLHHRSRILAKRGQFQLMSLKK